MLHFLIDLSRRLRGGAPPAVSVGPETRTAREAAEGALRIEPLEARDQPGVVWGT
jgi:hypothetical protein